MSGGAEAKSAVNPNLIYALIVFGLIMTACAGYLQPMLEDTRQVTLSARDAITGLNVQISDLAARRAREEVERRNFVKLEKDGFLGEQNRLNAARILEQLRIRHRIADLEYQIDAVETIPVLRQADGAGVMLSSSEISLTLNGFLDIDARDFSNAVRHGMPGHISLRQLEIVKLEPPAQELLADIRRGGGRALVRAKMVLQWQVAKISDSAAGL